MEAQINNCNNTHNECEPAELKTTNRIQKQGDDTPKKHDDFESVNMFKRNINKFCMYENEKSHSPTKPNMPKDVYVNRLYSIRLIF